MLLCSPHVVYYSSLNCVCTCTHSIIYLVFCVLLHFVLYSYSGLMRSNNCRGARLSAVAELFFVLIYSDLLHVRHDSVRDVIGDDYVRDVSQRTRQR